MKRRFTEEQIIGILKEAEAGLKVKDLCRQHNDILSLEVQILGA